MNIELCNPGIFKDAFDSISHIADEVEINFSLEDGMRLTALDKSHITFVELEFKPTLFDEFDCETPEKIIIDTTKFMSILKRMKKDDILKLSIDEGDLAITFEGEATRHYNLRLIDSEYESPQPPSIEFSATVKVPTSIVKDSISDMSLFSENCTFRAEENYFNVYSCGEFGDCDSYYLHGEDINGMYESSLSLDKLTDIFRASRISEECIIHLGDNIPIGVDFELVTGDGGIRFLVAPRLPAEDEY